jgi:hypothetical protein
MYHFLYDQGYMALENEYYILVKKDTWQFPLY